MNRIVIGSVVCIQTTYDIIDTRPTLNPFHRIGVIVTTSSNAAYDGQHGQAAYAAANAAIVGMTLPIARDLSSRGIRVVGIAPGLFNTQLCLADMTDEFKEFLEDTMVFPQRLGHPSEFAKLVETVVENPFLNGTTIRLDGGYRGFVQ